MKKYLENCLNFIKESKLYIITAGTIYIIAFFIGTSLTTLEAEFMIGQGYLKGSIGRSLFSDLMAIEKVKTKITNSSFDINTIDFFAGKTFKGVLTLWIDNILRGIVVCCFGFFLGIAPILHLARNGFYIGVIQKADFGLFGCKSLFLFLPHIAFEFLAIILILGLGIRLGVSYICRSSKGRVQNFKYVLLNVIKITPLYVTIFFLAAVIEIYEVPWLFSLSLKVF